MSNFYIIYATSTVHHEIKVIAESEEEAKQFALEGDYYAWDDIDSDNFQIHEVNFDGKNEENTNA